MAVAPISAKARPVTPTEDGLQCLTINGVRPFWSAGDCALTNLEEAHALLTVMSAAFNESGDEGVNSMNPKILAAAIDGIASLVALGLHHRDVAAKAREAVHG